MQNNQAMKRFVGSTLAAWLVFIGIDFFFHASLLKSLWAEPNPAIKPLGELAALIPAGYGSFLLLTILIGYLYRHIFTRQPARGEAFKFALVFALLFSAANFLGLYSYAAIPVKHLAIFNLVYFIEIMAVADIFYRTTHAEKPRRTWWLAVLIFLALIVAGVLVQNFMK